MSDLSTHLTTEQIDILAKWLAWVCDNQFGEVHITVQNGKVKFIRPMLSLPMDMPEITNQVVDKN